MALKEPFFISGKRIFKRKKRALQLVFSMCSFGLETETYTNFTNWQPFIFIVISNFISFSINRFC